MHRHTPRLIRSTFVRVSLCLITALCVPLSSAQLDQQPEQSAAASNVTTLDSAAAVERELGGNAPHTYTLTLTAGQFMDVVVNQQGVDVVVTLHGPDNKPLAEMDGPSATHAPERLSHIATTTGVHTVVVHSYNEFAPRGRYRITLEGPRAPEPTDRIRVEAQSRLIEGQQLWSKMTADSARLALPKLEESISLWRTLGDRSSEADALWYVGDAYRLMNETRHELATQLEQLGIRRGLSNVRMEAITLNNIAASYRQIGDYQKAMEYQSQALALARTIDNYDELGSFLQSMGRIYGRLGDSRRALEHFEAALPLHRARGFRDLESDALWDIGNAYFFLGDPQQALSYLRQALAIARTSKAARASRQQATTLSAMGRAYRAQGDAQSAIEHYEAAIALSRKIGWRHVEATALSDLGGTYASLGFIDKARDAFGQALAIQRAVRDREFETVTLTGMAQVESERGNLVLARQHLEQAIDIVDSQRSNLAQDALRATYRASKEKPFELYVDVLMRLHAQPMSATEAMALEASERWRARSLLEILTEAQADIRQGVDAELLERERRLQEQINLTAERQVQLLSAQRTQPAEVAGKQLDALVADYRLVQAEIRTRSPRYAALTQPRPLTAEEIQREVVDRDSLLLEYSLGTERSYLWAVTPDSLTSHTLPPRTDIETLARRSYELLTARNHHPAGETPAGRTARLDQADREYQRVAADLSRMLLGPVADALGTKRLIIVADGALQYIPFSALPAPRAIGSENPLILDHEIVTLPSASVLHVLRRELGGRSPAPKTIAVLADPVFSKDDPRFPRRQSTSGASTTPQPGTQDRSSSDMQRSAEESGVTAFERLRFTRQEAEAVAALAPAPGTLKATDFAANKATATSPELAGYRIVHFATHGLINNQNPELSGVVLSLVDEAGRPQDGFLRLHDIYNLKLGADLVVLSACRTALGKEIRGEGLVGLTRGFMYAGAPRVLASLWNVDDRATAELMKQLYTAVLKEGQPPSAALRAAQVEMWKNRRWQSAYYWAAFVMQGEWR
jgi:CHAT domain-containing protein/Flp pilus assembly protein TadD